MGNSIACADALMGALTYKQMRRSALILAAQLRRMPGKYLGIMLPSSVAVNLLIFAAQLADKIPVMFNWTSGVRTLNFASEHLDCRVVITSRRFLDRLDVFDSGHLEDRLIMLEDLKNKISLFDKLRGVFQASKNNRLLLDECNVSTQTAEDVAVVLFTSGTESYPKAVPLTHRNIMENQKAGFSSIDFCATDIIYCVLPPFHSFGFSVTGIFPLLCGVKAIYAPDPTDGAAMARDVVFWKVTIMCCAPSFYKNLFRVASPQDLAAVRSFISGAEKAPDELFRMVKDLGPDKQLLEGYGITECSPVVSICRSADQKGVGLPVPGVELCIIDPNTHAKLPQGQTGEVCIRGPSVFNGYLFDAPNPFIEIDGQTHYRSGDIGCIDEEDCLILKGRIKRFVKIGGEMVSLGSVEAALSEHFHDQLPNKDVPNFAVGIRDENQLTLFTTLSLDKETVNHLLRELGFGRIVKVHDVKTIEEIPVTGTGKVHYHKINEMAC